MNVEACNLFLQDMAVEGRGHGKKKFITRSKQYAGNLQLRQIPAHFLYAAPRHECDPGLLRIQLVLRGISCAIDLRAGKIGERVSDESRVHAAVAVELFFERKDHQRFVHIFSQQAYSALAPGPKLRTNVIDDGNAAFLHLASHAPVECRGVDDDGQVGPAPIGFRNQPMKKTPDFRQVAENLGNSDDRKLLLVDNCAAARGAHAISPRPKTLYAQ